MEFEILIEYLGLEPSHSSAFAKPKAFIELEEHDVDQNSMQLSLLALLQTYHADKSQEEDCQD